MVTDYQKRQIFVSGIIGLVLGFFLSLAFYFMLNNNPVAFVIIPIAVIMSIAQALIAPGAKNKE